MSAVLNSKRVMISAAVNSSMNAAAWVVTAAGSGLLGLVALDIYRTILHSRGRSEPVTETLTRAVWRLVRDVAFRRSRPARHQLLASTLNPAVHPGQEHPDDLMAKC